MHLLAVDPYLLPLCHFIIDVPLLAVDLHLLPVDVYRLLVDTPNQVNLLLVLVNLCLWFVDVHCSDMFVR